MSIAVTRREFIIGAGLATSGLCSCGQVGTPGPRGAVLRVGLATPPTTLDPLQNNNQPNDALAGQFFDGLVNLDAKLQNSPGLATSWRFIDDTHWEFVLRPNVVFSDGSAFGLDDVIASVHRASTIASPSPFSIYTASIAAIDSPGPGRIIVTTKYPDPLLPNSLSRIRIISAKYRDVPSAQFDLGPAMIGTGPFILSHYLPGNEIAMKVNPRYWGPKFTWPTVIMRLIPDDGARLAALIAGDMDLVEALPLKGIPRVTIDSDLRVARTISSRIVFLALDQKRDVTPYITANDGKPLTSNPLKDVRVRHALSLAINRKGIVSRLMGGNAVVAAQFLPNGMFGTAPDLRPTPYDPTAAKRLLTEAGYPAGFQMTIHGPSDRFVDSVSVLEALAEMFTAIGIQTRVETMPFSVYTGKSHAADFSVTLYAWGINTGETSNPLIALTATHDPAKDMGANNMGRYSNPRLDGLLRQAARTMNDDARRKLLEEASRIVFTEYALLPLHFEDVVVGMHRNIEYTPRADGFLLVAGAKPFA